MKYSLNLIIYSMMFLTLSIILLFLNTFITMEIPLINMMSFHLKISIMLDWISSLFMSTVMFISSMIIIFSMFYIPYKNQNQFFLMLMMFILSMLILIMSDNIILILLGWDGLGLSSYILVVFYQNHISAASGTITLLSNRLGDILMMMAIAMLFMNCNWNFNMNKEYNLLTMMFLLIAASSKSAQFPFSAWLPAAMAAPTPISALVHSSTLVTAGVFLLIRIMNNIHPMSLIILMIMSSATALYAGMAANWEQDIKKIIALSTLSQIAIMMFALSMNSTTLAFFHLITHALFKSTMFLCVGTMIHNSSYQDMRMMGMNFYNSPLPLTILSISTMALMGLPFMSGFFSKDMIIQTLLTFNTTSILSYMMIMSIGMTASYTIRMLILSTNNMIKSKPDMNIHNTNHANMPISLMISMPIISGSMFLWSTIPEQIFILSLQLKTSILMMILLGLILGYMMQFKSNSFIKLGESSISMWFLHYTTVIIMKSSSPLMSMMYKNDNSWQESYGPQKMFYLNTNLSSIPHTIKMTFMLALTLMIIMPIIMN